MLLDSVILLNGCYISALLWSLKQEMTRDTFPHQTPSLCVFLASSCVLFPGFWCVSGLEVSTGKITVMEAMNGSTVLIPCTYSSCIGIQRLYFNWHYDDNGTMLKVGTQQASSPCAHTLLKSRSIPFLAMLAGLTQSSTNNEVKRHNL